MKTDMERLYKKRELYIKDRYGRPFLLSRLTNAILKPWWLYLEIDWKDIWKPERVDILNWCDKYYLHVEIHPLCI